MANRRKGKEVASDSPAIGSSCSVDVNESDVSKPSTLSGEALASEEQPLWKKMKAVTKNVGSGGGGNVHFVCKHCENTHVGSYTRIKAHLLKLPGHGIQGCKKISTEKAREFKRLQDRADEIHNKKKTSIIVTNLKSSNRKRKTIETCFDSCGSAEIDKVIAKFFYSSCIPFNVSRNPYWKKACSMLANSKLSGYLPPGSKRLCTSLLHNEKNEVEQSLERKKFKWNTTGVSIVSDGWTDIQRRPLINFIVIARDEPIFLKAVDASGEYKDAGYLKQLFVEAIKELGPDKVVQLITDNDAVCKSAGLSLRRCGTSKRRHESF